MCDNDNGNKGALLKLLFLNIGKLLLSHLFERIIALNVGPTNRNARANNRLEVAEKFRFLICRPNTFQVIEKSAPLNIELFT